MKYETKDGDHRRVTEGTVCPFYRVPQHGNFTVQRHRTSSGAFRESCRAQPCHKTDYFSNRTSFCFEEMKKDTTFPSEDSAEIRPGGLMNVSLEHLQPQLLLYKARNSYDIKISIAVYEVRIT